MMDVGRGDSSQNETIIGKCAVTDSRGTGINHDAILIFDSKLKQAINPSSCPALARLTMFCLDYSHDHPLH